MRYSIWTNEDRDSISLIAGEGPPRFADGTFEPDMTCCLHTFEAESSEEAMRRYRELMD
jgi:hypothetical protein